LEKQEKRKGKSKIGDLDGTECPTKIKQRKRAQSGDFKPNHKTQTHKIQKNHKNKTPKKKTKILTMPINGNHIIWK